ncbi:Uncharacterised protein [Neisseria gonorrhoeae]|uniref:Uncharacterized protein n=1 Tax=Neisseria gonorrhoeae TaxID=485 RepID=A0A378W1K0_NEIGO|nr:Uncharacterised protein [Neisseria gonorrhoeae]
MANLRTIGLAGSQTGKTKHADNGAERKMPSEALSDGIGAGRIKKAASAGMAMQLK